MLKAVSFINTLNNNFLFYQHEKYLECIKSLIYIPQAIFPEKDGHYKNLTSNINLHTKHCRLIINQYNCLQLFGREFVRV